MLADASTLPKAYSPHHVGFGSCGLQALECRLSSCGTTACRTFLDQVEPMSPVLAGGFLTSGPPEKSPKHHFKLAQEVCEIPSISLSHFTDEDVKIQVKRSDS